MKKVKKIFAILMTLAMIMGLGMTAFAEAGNNQISVTGTGIDSSATVKYGQIIEEDRTSTLGWKFVGGNDGSIATTFVTAWNGVEPTQAKSAAEVIKELTTEGEGETSPNYDVKNGKVSDHSRFTAALQAVSSQATNSMTFDSDNKEFKSDSNLTKGLYVVTASKTGYSYLPMAAYIDSAGNGVDVVAKGSENQIYKTVDSEGTSVAPGDTVSYTVKQQYLYYAPNTSSKTFTVTDTITNGTLSTDTIKVYLTNTADGEPSEDDLLTVNNDYTINVTSTGYTIDFGSKYNAAYAGQTIQIKYDIVVGANVSADDNGAVKNQVASSNGTGTIVETKPVSFTVTKLDQANNNPLSGAEFTIYKDVTQGTSGAVELTVDNETKYGVEVTTITTGANGEATYNKLDADIKYYVKETKAPEGYSIYDDKAYELTGAKAEQNTPIPYEAGSVTYNKITYDYTDFTARTFEDTTLSALPSTGGIGTTIFTIGGIVIMIAAAALFFANRRKNNAQ